MSPHDVVARGLRRYVTLVAQHAGVGAEACSIQFAPPVGAYVALDQHLPRFPERDVALLWDTTCGWALAIETHGGADLTVLGYLARDVLPLPHEVADGLRRAVRGVGTGFSRPPATRADDDLTASLTHYAQRAGTEGR